MRIVFIIIGCFFYIVTYAQTNELQNQLLANMFGKPSNGLQEKRTFIAKGKSVSIVKKIAGVPIYLYQNIMSEQIQANCTYEISCSEYIKLCIAKYGFVKGTMAGLNQFSKCNANNFKNHLPFRVDDNYKIINAINDEEN